MEQDQGFPAAKLFIVNIYAVGFYEFSLGSCGIFICQRHCHLLLFHVHLTKGGLTVLVSGASPQEWVTKRDRDFERIKASKRDVAKRPLHAMLGLERNTLTTIDGSAPFNPLSQSIEIRYVVYLAQSRNRIAKSTCHFVFL